MANRIEFETFVNPAGFKKGLAAMEASADATNMRLQNALRASIATQESRLKDKNSGPLDTIDAEFRILMAKQRLSKVEDLMYVRHAETRIAIKKAEAEEVLRIEAQTAAAIKAEQLALITSVAMGNGASASAGGGHGHAGLSGIIRESLVIVRELSMGRGFGRVAGSVTLLAQYMGLLGTVVKSTASEALKASAAVSELSVSMSQAAYAAEAKAAASMEANVATGGLVVATRLQAEADGEAAIAARANAVAQEAKAVASADAAKVALASAVVSVSAIGWIIAAVVLLGAAIFAVAWHFHTLSVRAKNLADMLDPLKKKFTDEADAVRNAAKAHQEYIDELKKTSEHTESLVDQTDALIKKIKEQSRAQIELATARGASHAAIERMEEAELRQEAAITQKALDRATAERNYQTIEVAKAESSYNANLKGDIKGAQNSAHNAGEILDAVQAAMTAKGTITTGGQITGGSSISGFTRAPLVTRATNENDEFTVKVDGKEVTTSVAVMKENYKKVSKSANALEDAQTHLKDVLNDAQSTLKQRNEAVDKLTKAEKDYQDQIGIKSTIGRQVANAQDAKNFGSGHGSDSMVKVGNFLGTARSGINSLAEKQIRLAEESLLELKGINSKMPTAHSQANATTFSGY